MSVLAMDFGGTRIKAGLVSSGEVYATHVWNTATGSSFAAHRLVLERTMKEIASTVASPVEAMVWALPCLVAPDHQTITRTFGKFDDTMGVDLAAWVRQHFDLPLVLENDARAAAIGEWSRGAGKGCDDMVMVTLGTGIGTAVINGGGPLHGRTGLAGNLGGHTIIHSGGRKCSCGLRGCAEAHIASWALPGVARESALFFESELANAEVIDYRTVFELARRGDLLAQELKAHAIHDWSVVLGNLIHQFDPECLVIGGGIMAGKDEILPLLESSLREMFPASRDVAIRAAMLGDSAALVGCAALWAQVSSHLFPS